MQGGRRKCSSSLYRPAANGLCQRYLQLFGGGYDLGATKLPQYLGLNQRRLVSTSRDREAKLRAHFDDLGSNAFPQGSWDDERRKEGGLYGIHGLVSPKSWNALCDNAIKRTEELVELAISKGKENQRKPSLRTKVETLKALDGVSASICSMVDPAELCRHTHPDPAFVAAAGGVHSRLSTMIHELNTNVDVYNAIVAVTDDNDPEQGFKNLTPEQQIVSKQLQMEFELNGIHLPEEKRKKIVSLQSRLTDLTYEFGGLIGIGEEYNSSSIEVDTTRLQGLSQELIRRLPKGKHQGTVRIECSAWLSSEILRCVDEEDMRKEVYTLSNASHSTKALKVLEELLRTRDQLAKVLEFPSFAALSLAAKMAKSPENVQSFLDELSAIIKPKAEEEMASLRALKISKNFDRTGKMNKEVTIYGWDKAYYMNLIAPRPSWRTKEYFSLGNCISGLDMITNRLFGISLEVVPMRKNESWDSHVQKLKLTHETEGLIGYVYLDLFPRQGKFNSAANFAIEFAHLVSKSEALKQGRTEEDFLGYHCRGSTQAAQDSNEDYLVPRVALVCNFDEPMPVLHKPSLLTHDEVETLFHEFGHALSNLLSRTTFQHTAGTRGQLDFVETPSTLMEYFASSEKILPLFARHYKTGDILPNHEIAALQNHKTAFSALNTQQQILFSVVDQVYHGPHPLPGSLTNLLGSLHDKYTNFPLAEGSNWPASFGHLGGYGASYYSYLYSRVFSANMWEKHFGNSSDPLSRATGERYRQTILAHGGARDSNEMLEDFLGTKPSLLTFAESAGCV